ncbi:MAG: glycerol-3-phosphate acyltransferase [Dehalococcoidia bacterium]
MVPGWEWLSLLAMAYLVGSFPTGYLAGRWLQGVDIRELGDRNMGAANAFRCLGMGPGLAVGAVDMAKGALAVLLARQLLGTGSPEMLAGAAAVVGHTWPLFLQFQGGRGAATAVGVLLTVLPRATLPLALLSLVLLTLSRSSTLALAFIFITLPLAAWATGASLNWLGYAVALPSMVGLTHYLSARQPALPKEATQEPATPPE